MKLRTRSVLLGIACLVSTVVVAAPAAEEGGVTVGDLAVGLARIVTGKPYDVDGARAVLDQMGVGLSGESDRPVDQAYLIEALGPLGIRLTTDAPSEGVTREQLDALGSLFSLERGPDPCPPSNTGHPSCNGIRCRRGDNNGKRCTNDADCPGGFCRVPPGLGRKIATPS